MLWRICILVHCLIYWPAAPETHKAEDAEAGLLDEEGGAVHRGPRLDHPLLAGPGPRLLLPALPRLPARHRRVVIGQADADAGGEKDVISHNLSVSTQTKTLTLVQRLSLCHTSVLKLMVAINDVEPNLNQNHWIQLHYWHFQNFVLTAKCFSVERILLVSPSPVASSQPRTVELLEILLEPPPGWFSPNISRGLQYTPSAQS